MQKRNRGEIKLISDLITILVRFTHTASTNNKKRISRNPMKINRLSHRILYWSLLINKSAVCTFSRLLWLTPITMKISEN